MALHLKIVWVLLARCIVAVVSVAEMRQCQLGRSTDCHVVRAEETRVSSVYTHE